MIPSAEMLAAEGAPAGEPKRLYRLVEPIYDSLDHADPVSFYSAALARTASRLSVECGITSTLLARRDGPD